MYRCTQQQVEATQPASIIRDPAMDDTSLAAVPDCLFEVEPRTDTRPLCPVCGFAVTQQGSAVRCMRCQYQYCEGCEGCAVQ